MIIRTKRLKLRKFKQDDIKWYVDFAKDEELKSTLPNLFECDKERVKKDVDIFVNGDCINDFYIVICDYNENIIGLIVAVRIDSYVIDISYYILSEYRGNGYMLEAMKEFIKYAKKVNNQYVFCFVINEDNKYSFNIAKELGAKGSLKDSKYILYI